MGKTTLTRRLKELAVKEFQGQYQTVLIDWDRQRDLNIELQRGHSNIKPQTVLDVLHKELEQSLNSYTGEFYTQARQEIQEIESKVEKTLAAEPPNTELKEITAQYGGKAIAWILDKATEGVITTDPTGAAVAIKVGATLLSQARQLTAKSLSTQEVKIFQQPPWEKLADGLGKDIAKATQRQPGIIFLDTYEIIDRQVCDYVLRQVIQQGSNRVIWTISGRSNLAKSGKRGEKYFRGYADDFSEAQIYPRELLQFSSQEIRAYFEEKVSEVSLTEEDAEAIAEFSLGIPFVVDLAAVMYGKGKPIAEIVAPVANEYGNTNDRDQVIKETCERFLKHCLDTPETLSDRQLTFALAMLRRSQMDVLGAMVDAPTGLKKRLKTLQGRYAFLAEDEQRLDEKMSNFMQDYLLQDLQRQDDLVQGLNDSAIAWLELQIKEKQKNLSDTAEWFEDERLAAWMLDLAHHYGWRGEDVLWEYLVPRFIEAWQYDRAWAKSLLQVAETFRRLLGAMNRKILGRMAAVLEPTPDLEDTAILLDTLDKWLTRQILESAKAQELETILQLRRGRYLYQSKRENEALTYSLSMADGLPKTVLELTKAISNFLKDLGFRLGWRKGNAIKSSDAKRTFERAIQLNSENAYAYYGLGCMQYRFGEAQQAILSLQKAINLREGQYTSAFDTLGSAYSNLKQYDDAIASYQKAIALDPDDTTAYYNIGITYQALKRYDDAIASYQKAIVLDPDYAMAYNNLGNTYKALKQYDDAIASYQKAIALDPDYAMAYNNLGNTYSDLKQYDDAIASYQKAIALDSDYATAYKNLGDIYHIQDQYENAIASYQKAIKLEPKNSNHHLNLANTLAYDGQYHQAILSYQKVIELTPDDYLANNNLGWMCLLTNQLSLAQTAFERTIEVDKTDVRARLNLALALKNQGQLERADELYQQVLELELVDDEDKVAHAFYSFVLGKIEYGMTQMQDLIAANVNVGDLENELNNAEMLAACPQPPERIEEMITLLRDAISKSSANNFVET